MKKLKRSWFVSNLFFILAVSLYLTGCTHQTESDENQSSEISDLFLQEDTMIEYETVFDPDDTTITEVYDDDDDNENILDAEGETSVEIEIPEE